MAQRQDWLKPRATYQMASCPQGGAATTPATVEWGTVTGIAWLGAYAWLATGGTSVQDVVAHTVTVPTRLRWRIVSHTRATRPGFAWRSCGARGPHAGPTP